MIKKYILNIYNKIINNIIRVYNMYLKYFVKSPNIKLIEETIEYIIENKCSVSRFGDGELQIMLGNGIRYQNPNIKLQNKLQKVISSKETNHLVTLPDVFTTERLSLRTNENQLFWKRHLERHRKDWYRFILKDKVYYNTALSRFYIPIKDKEKSNEYLTLLRQIWEDKDVIIIEGEKSRLGVGNDLFENTNKIERILCPSENAFEKYEDIINRIKLEEKNKLILIALGPTATAMAYDLYKLGYWAIDIGHIDMEYEWFKMGVTSQVRIANKYTNEVKGGDIVEDIDDDLYNNQIISIVK